MENNNLKTEDLDLRTPLQKKKGLRNEKIIDDYRTIKLNLPENATKWAIYRKLGETYGMQPQGIRSIITKMENN